MASQISEERSDLHSPKHLKIAAYTSDGYDSEEERSDLPSPKHEKMMEGKTCDDYDSEGQTCDDSDSEGQTCDDSDLEDPYYDSDDPYEGTPEERQQFEDQCRESQGFEMDFSKYTSRANWQGVDLEDSTWRGYETDREFIAMLAKLALTDRNTKYGTSLELGTILRANFHPSCGATFYISFEVNDPSESDGNQTKPFRAVVRHLRSDDMEVYSCDPKPSP